MVRCNLTVMMKIENVWRFSQRLNLMDKIEHSWEWRAPHDDRNRAVLTKVEPGGQGWTLLGMALPMRWPKYISVSIPLEADASRDTADADRGQRIW